MDDRKNILERIGKNKLAKKPLPKSFVPAGIRSNGESPLGQITENLKKAFAKVSEFRDYKVLQPHISFSYPGAVDMCQWETFQRFKGVSLKDELGK